MPYIELSDGRLWVMDTGGEGVPVVLLHAASGTCESWRYQTPVLTGAGYRCIAYDRRGWGRSGSTETGEAAGDARADLHGLVNALHLDRLHVVATAAGGIVGLDYAAAYPERVRSLVVANSISGIQDADYLEVQQRLRLPEIQALPVELRELGPSYRGLHPEGVRQWLEIEQTSRPRGAHGPTPPLREPMTYARLEAMQVPVLVLAGEADLLSPPALMRLVASRIPDCQFVTVTEAGHAAFWEQPDLWNRHVLDFIGRHG